MAVPGSPFRKILIANRGEIACRVIRTARKMGVETVAVYSDADTGALHTTMADTAVRIGPPPAAESYLRGDRIVAAALETGAEAVHPGYGFLSENPDFVDQVNAASLVFIGPSAAAIRAMGLKDAAKRLMEKAGVPVVPGYHGDGQELVLLAGKAREIGYPVLIKARAGGGGKGMRRVDHPDQFAESLAAARREAKAAFGDDRVLVEKYVERPRHIEVQVFGDNHGNAVHLFERDCSVQRRHQKVIEEAPAPGMTEELRSAMTEAAVKAAKAIGYSGAGTVEFIVDSSRGLRPDGFWFMEMNTRLQVEHPVTEMVTGIDLVEWQLRVAAGEILPRTQAEISLNGHAFEARVYAEDPARDFLPATGALHHLSFPLAGPALRVETGVRTGDTISPFYDPMIAKIVVRDGDRARALSSLGEALRRTEIAGSITNVAFLAALAADPAFVSGDLDTGLIGRRQDALTAPASPDAHTVALAALAAAQNRTDRTCDEDPWSSLTGYAHFHGMRRPVQLAFGGEKIAAEVVSGAKGSASVEVNGHRVALAGGPDARPAAVRWPGHVTVFGAAGGVTFGLRDPFAQAADTSAGAEAIRSPMPGLVKLVRVRTGDKVVKGQPMMILEAMKMEHSIAASHDATIAEIVTEGRQVSDGEVLVRFETPAEQPA